MPPRKSPKPQKKRRPGTSSTGPGYYEDKHHVISGPTTTGLGRGPRGGVVRKKSVMKGLGRPLKRGLKR